MNKWKSYLRKSLKVVVLVVDSFVFISTFIALLIRIPAHQTTIVNYATATIRSKTLTKVEIGIIGI